MTLRQHLDIEFYKLNRPDYFIFFTILVISLVAFPIYGMIKLSPLFTLNEFFSIVNQVGTLAVVYGAIVAITREFTNGTNRKRIVNGYSRTDLFISKLVIVFYYVSTVVVLTAFTLLALVAFKGSEVFINSFPIQKLMAVLAAIICYGLIGASLGAVTTKAHRAILIFWGIGFLEMALNILSLTHPFAQFFRPLVSIGNFTSPEHLYTWHYIILGLFLAGLLGGSFLKFKRADF
ncbi:hypothetical protein KIH41_13185 [Litoribacter ruber]|uniref:Uncharacterized protein n=1 Tax=Litoribacter ruber TaxID=702568 RepID=A0AAP2CHC7_9BACT|nr:MULTISPECIES: hypothetical protein [Litoribacter]MBS9523719.1 hypothetical protein [Litoribacter alkaliphilus]MBT0812233.1 hypothetical protein [Litoribacter ruber]